MQAHIPSAARSLPCIRYEPIRACHAAKERSSQEAAVFLATKSRTTLEVAIGNRNNFSRVLEAARIRLHTTSSHRACKLSRRPYQL